MGNIKYIKFKAPILPNNISENSKINEDPPNYSATDGLRFFLDLLLDEDDLWLSTLCDWRLLTRSFSNVPLRPTRTSDGFDRARTTETALASQRRTQVFQSLLAFRSLTHCSPISFKRLSLYTSLSSVKFLPERPVLSMNS